MSDTAQRDANRVPTLLGVSDADGITPTLVYANATGHRLLVSGVGSTGPTGPTAVPAGNDTQVQFNNTGAFGADASFTWDNASHVLGVTGQVEVGNVGTEGGGIVVNGVPYDSELKVSDIGGLFPAQFLVHKHSTTSQPVVVGARSNTDNTSHADVTGGQSVISVIGVGVAGSDYKQFASIDLAADDTGSISNTSSPGKLVLNVTPDGGVTPAAAIIIRNSGLVVSNNDVAVDSGPKGLILKDQAVTPHYWRVTVNTTGALTVSDIGTALP